MLTGPHNALTLEPMNSVLDDNKVLLVPAAAPAAAATRVPLPRRVTVLLMSTDCADWSPASVSRVGVVYVAPEEEERPRLRVDAVSPRLHIGAAKLEKTAKTCNIAMNSNEK